MKNNYYQLFCITTLIISLVILVDYVIPAKDYTEQIVDVKTKTQNYYNAARNNHYTHEVLTENIHFNVSKEFAQEVKENEFVNYSISPIFKEVNQYSKINSSQVNAYSLRLMSGCVIPLFAILIMIIRLKHPHKIFVLSFVVQVVSIGNFIWVTFILWGLSI